MNREGKLNNMLNPVLDKIVNNSVYIQKPVKIERDKDYVLKLQNQIESGTQSQWSPCSNRQNNNFSPTRTKPNFARSTMVGPL